MNEDRIWEFIDHPYSDGQEDRLFEESLLNDSLGKRLESTQHLDSLLKEHNRICAPQVLVESTLQKLAILDDSKISALPLFVFLSAILVIGIVSVVLNTQGVFSSGLNLAIPKWIPATDIDWSMWHMISPYLVVLLVLPVFHGIDMLLRFWLRSSRHVRTS